VNSAAPGCRRIGIAAELNRRKISAVNGMGVMDEADLEEALDRCGISDKRRTVLGR